MKRNLALPGKIVKQTSIVKCSTRCILNVRFKLILQSYDFKLSLTLTLHDKN